MYHSRAIALCHVSALPRYLTEPLERKLAHTATHSHGELEGYSLVVICPRIAVEFDVLADSVEEGVERDL